MILQIIQDYSVFTVKQALVHLQLAVALHQFESTMDTMQISQMFEIGDDTVSLYTCRVCAALMPHWRQHVHWPTDEEQTKMKL